MENKKIQEEALAIAAYEDFGEDYAKVLENNAYNAHFERPSTLALLPDVAGLHVLDAGCGPGAYVKLLLERKARVTGVDVSPAMLKIAQRRFQGQADFHLHDLSKPMTMFRDGSFDVILSSLTLHYVEDLSLLMAEWNRVLKRGGCVVCSTHHPVSDFGDSPSGDYFKRELLDQEWDTVGRPVRVRFYRRPLSELTRAIAEHDFMIEALTEGVFTEDLNRLYPVESKRMTRRPPFLFLRLRK